MNAETLLNKTVTYLADNRELMCATRDGRFTPEQAAQRLRSPVAG